MPVFMAALNLMYAAVILSQMVTMGTSTKIPGLTSLIARILEPPLTTTQVAQPILAVPPQLQIQYS